MTSWTLEVFPDTHELCERAADRIADILATTIARRGIANLVLTGGNTPRMIYQRLAQTPFRERLSWERVEFFWGDERCVPPDHRDSNFGMASEAILSELRPPKERVHRMRGELESPERAALEYEKEIQKALSAQEDGRLDLVLLGMGDDGHTASLFPGVEWEKSRVVVAPFIPKLQASRISMTPKLLNSAREIVFLVSGTSKARVLPEVLEDPKASYPAKLIQPTSGRLTWMVDAAAAVGLKTARS